MSLAAVPLGRLEKVRVRDAWPDEARNFTPWLATEGIELLKQELGVDLKVLAREHAVGRYSLDILASELTADGSADTEKLVVIENQFGSTDHDHLGKLLTYASGVGEESTGAKTIIWIAEDFREEHQQALEWLNKVSQSNIRFYGVQLELYKIGDSLSAPALNVLVRPNEVARARQEAPTQKGNSEWHLLYVEYWTAFKAFCVNQNATFRLQTPRPQSWMESPLGRAGFYLSFLAARRDRWIGCELDIRATEPNAKLQALMNQREQIEQEIGHGALNWLEVSSKFCKVEFSLRNEDPADRTRWEEQHKLLLSIGEGFHRVFRPRIQAL